jgi:hypothetical protein
MFLTAMSPDHEPTLRELLVEINATRSVLLAKLDGLERVMNERDRTYTERDIAAKEAVRLAVVAAEHVAKRTESALDENRIFVSQLQKFRNEHIGESIGGKGAMETTRANLAVVIAFVSLLVAVVIALWK